MNEFFAAAREVVGEEPIAAGGRRNFERKDQKMKNLAAARDAVGSEEPIAAGGWFFLWQELHELIELNESNKDRLLDAIYFFGESTGLTSNDG